MLAALTRALPGEDLIYLGDTARVPYGSRSAGTVRRYARRVAGHLWRQGVKALVVACNTATTYALEDLRAAGARAGVPVIGVIKPGAREALRRAPGGHVAVLGTEGTIRGGRYQEALAGGARRVSAVACPLFVALAEEGWTDGDIARLAAARYLGGLAADADPPDVAVLGCTHYPLLRGAIADALPGVALVDSADSTAADVAERLRADGLLQPDRRRRGAARFLVTDNPARFHDVGARFLGHPPEPIEQVDLEVASGIFATEAPEEDA